jgi:hypothetical protein
MQILIDFSYFELPLIYIHEFRLQLN